MNSRGALLVLFVLCLSEAGARGESGGRVDGRESHVEAAGTLSFSDMWNELKQLRDLVVEQREKLRHMEELRDIVVEQRERLRTLEARVAASEEEAKEQRNLAADLGVELTIARRAIEGMAKDNTASTRHAQLSLLSENHLQELLPFSNMFMKDTQVKVSFYAGLSNSGVVGPFDSDTTVVYSRFLTNVYWDYDYNTGVFTTTGNSHYDVEVYYFRFTAAFSVPSSSSGEQCIQMFRNDQPLTYNCGYSPGPVHYVSNGAIVETRGKDRIYVRLPAGWKLHDSDSSHNMFSGVMIYRRT